MSDVDAKVATAADPTPSSASRFEEHRPHSEERPRAPLRRQLPIPLGQRTIGGQLRRLGCKWFDAFLSEISPLKSQTQQCTGNGGSRKRSCRRRSRVVTRWVCIVEAPPF